MTVGSPRSSSLIVSLSRATLKDPVSQSNSSICQRCQKLLPPADERFGRDVDTAQVENMSLHLLPYDLLLNISSYLDFPDVHALQSTCKSLYYSSTTRPVYRKLATDLLRRCRPLPLKGFQRLSDLTTPQLIHCVNKAHHYERAWLLRAPRPISAPNKTRVDADVLANSIGPVNTRNNYLDSESPTGTDSKGLITAPNKWYKVVRAPPGEEVDWLSPITSSYTLCATKSGKVVCWDVQTDTCLAEWNPGERWELWKCRVEFEEKMVYFTMAKVLHGSYDDSRVMEFALMRLQFYENASGKKTALPTFSHVASFKTVGVVMNIFLLDPSARLLSAFIWVSSSNTIGLYVLLDWEKDDHVFIDTGIECVMSSNWSCILFERNIVIHCEDSDSAFQHFYPLTLLETHAREFKSKQALPTLSGRVTPFESIVKRFTFPVPKTKAVRRVGRVNLAGGFTSIIPITVIDSDTGAIITVTTTVSASPHALSTSSTSSSMATALSVASTSSSASNSVVSPSPATSPVPSSSQSSAQPSSNVSHTASSTPFPHPNPFPFPPWYPESAHFVRQWWPTLPNVPRVSCTVVLLASHDPITHKTRFVLAQHYFRVPMLGAQWVGFGEKGKGGARRNGRAHGHNADDEDYGESTVGTMGSMASAGTMSDGRAGESVGPMELFLLDEPPEGSIVRASNGSRSGLGWKVNGKSRSCAGSSSSSSSGKGKGKAKAGDDGDDDDVGDPSLDGGGPSGDGEEVEDDAMRLWYVSDPFEVVCLEDSSPEDEDGMQERPRPLVAVDFGHAVWIEYIDNEEERSSRRAYHRSSDESDDEENNAEAETGTGTGTGETEGAADGEEEYSQEPKRLRFVTFPPFAADGRVRDVNRGWGGAEVRTLETPPDLDLHSVETINIDQSQGAIILSVRQGKIFILCYE